MFTSVPAAGAGTSASTLSVEISTSGSSASTRSPTCFNQPRTVPSVTDSPIWGMVIWTLVARVAIRLSTVAPIAHGASLWAVRTIRSAAAVALVAIAVLGGGLLALATHSAERDLSVGRIELSVQPFHAGALDLYVPLVDWGARFSAVRFPARLSIDVRTVNRHAAERVADGELPDVRAVRHEARDAVASYLRVLLLVVFLCALVAGLI